MPHTSVFGRRDWIRYTLTDANGMINGTYCGDEETHDQLVQYLPEGEC